MNLYSLAPAFNHKVVWKAKLLPAHAHRHERHDEVVVCKMNRIHCLSVKFLLSPGIPGLGFGTVLLFEGLVARVSRSLISSPFLIKTKHPKRKEYLICGVKGKNDFLKYKIF
jgi:hypothetical protein